VILVSPAEPKALRDVGESSSLAETYGADILITGYSKLVGIQRKQFPGDFLSSLTDGRLQTSLLKLTQCTMGILVLEGKPAWSYSGALIGYSYGQGRTYTRNHLRSLLFSVQSELEIATQWTDSVTDTIEFVQDLEGWAQKDEHQTLFTRPNVKKGDMERKISARTKAAWVLQGVEGLGYTRACAVYDYFGRLPLKWDVTEKELLKVPGIGKGTVKRMTEAIGVRDE
jgi:ERCC4-type nuclease